MRSRRIEAVVVLALLLACGLPAPAGAYTQSLATFNDGSASSTITIPFPPGPQIAGNLTLLSNGTVTSASATLSGERYAVPVNFTHNSTSGFAQGAWDSGLENSPAGLRDQVVSGSVEFSGVGFDGGTYDGTQRNATGVVLSCLTLCLLVITSNTYTSPLIPWNGLSYGRLIADANVWRGGSISYEVLSQSGAVLQTGLRPGDLISVNGAAEPYIQIRATFDTVASPSPILMRLGAGYVLVDSMGQPGAAYHAPATLVNYGGALELRESLLNFSENPSNPVFTGTRGTWYDSGPLTGTAMTVGNQVWMYVTGIDSAGSYHIGRMVSSNGGLSWTIDAQPLLNTTGGTWDTDYVGIPSVLYEGGQFQMWYMGANPVDQFRIGYATSPDGITWTKYASNPVLGPGASGSWDDWNAGWPNVIKVGSTYYLYYSGRPSFDARKSVGLATSSDGITWTKSASNPLINWGSVSGGQYELAASEIAYANGLFYLYWTGASSASDYDTCVSTSTDGTSWTHFNFNPIITHGDGSWDSLTAELATRVVDPATNHSRLYFTGRPPSIVYSLGYATPKRESPGKLTAVWDLSGEQPRSFTSHLVNASTPPATSLLSSLSSSYSNASWGAVESVVSPDSNIDLVPDRFLRETIDFSATNLTVSPRLSSTAIAYDLHKARGSFISVPVLAPYPIADVTLWLNGTFPANTTLQMWASNDNGSTWVPASNGTKAVFSSPGVVLRYKLAFNGTTYASPLVARVTGFLGVDSTPSDVRIEAAGGVVLGQMSGELLAPVVVPLDAAFFNTRLAPYSGNYSSIPIVFPLFANASTAGIVHIDSIRFDLRFPDLLNVAFTPDTSFFFVELGATQDFHVIASTTPGVPISYQWTLDGIISAQPGPLLSFPAVNGTQGNHTVSVQVSNGEFTVNRTWNFRVIPKPVYFVTAFYPNTHTIEVTVGHLQQFFASVAFAVYPVTISWNLDGRIAGNLTGFDFFAPLQPGIHNLTVAVTNGIETQGWEWTISVVAEPTAPSTQLSVEFSPAGNLTLLAGENASFFANATSPIPGVHYLWHIDSVLTGGDASSFVWTTNASSAGHHLVSILVRNATAIAAHTWAVDVTLRGLGPPPTITITSPANNSVRQNDTVRVEGVASPGTTVAVNGHPATVDENGSFSVEVSLHAGRNPLVAIATDSAGRVATAEVSVTYTAPPRGTTTTATADADFPWLLLFIVVLTAAGVLGFLYMRERRRRDEQQRP